MDFEGIPPISSAQVTPAVSQRSQSGRGGGQNPGRGSTSEPRPETENKPSEEVEFSALDPMVGAILAEVTPAACGKVAEKVKEILPD
jgi:hypothetical protein